MVTWPAGTSEADRAFLTRQAELRERLRWVPPRSTRAKRLRAELEELTRAELKREVRPELESKREQREPWWQK